MAEPASHYRSYIPDNDGYEYEDEELTDRHVPSYRFGHSGRTNSDRGRSVPLFLSDSDGEPHPGEYMTPRLGRSKASVSSRILAGVTAMAAMAILFALFSSDATRDIIVSAKASLEASIAAVLPASSAAAQPDSTRLTSNDVQVKDPARLSAPANQTPGPRSVMTVAVAPTRSEINSAYQSAIQGRVPAVALSNVAAPVAAPIAAPTARKIDAGELAALLNRAKGLLTAGDIPPARLLLERAADAQQADAALLLAQTYDPDVLGTQDIRNITPEPATARTWYQRAAQLGSADAQRRLSQLQN
jgi:TPR repeat protein